MAEFDSIEDNKSEKQIFEILNTGTVAVAAITLFSYLLAYIYELGSCVSSGVPTSFIEITFQKIVISLAYLLLTTVLYGIYRGFLYILFYEKFKTVYSVLREHSIMFFFLIAIFVGSNGKLLSPENWHLTFFLILLVFIPVIILILLEKLILKKRAKMNLDQPTKANIVSNRLLLWGANPFLIILILLMSSMGSFFIGMIDTSSRTEYNIIETKPFMIILKENNNRFVCTELINDSTMTYSEFKLIDFSFVSINGLKMQKKNIGEIKYIGLK